MVTVPTAQSNMVQDSCEAPSQQQQCMVAMLVPAEQFHSYFPGVPCAFPCQAAQMAPVIACNGSVQGQCQMPYFPQQHSQPQMFSAPLMHELQQPQVQVPSMHQQIPQMPQMPQMLCQPMLELQQTGSCSASGQLSDRSTSPSEEPEEPQQTKLTTSAARRLRRKRAAERSAAASNGEEGSSTAAHRPLASVDFNKERCEQLSQQLSEGDNQDVLEALATLRGCVWSLARDATGCRLVQLALERAGQREAAELAQELRGRVGEAATSPHANYVLQKVVSQLNVSSSSFVAKELLMSNPAKIVRHRYGCRILCRLLEFNASSDATRRLIDEVLVEAEDLCCHSFGHHVIQSVLEHGEQQHRDRVAAALLSDPLGYAKHRNASYLIEKALTYCSQEDQEALLNLLGHPDTILDLALSQYGCYVARSLMQDQRTDCQAAMARIRSVKAELEQTRHGQHFLADLGLTSEGDEHTAC